MRINIINKKLKRVGKGQTYKGRIKPSSQYVLLHYPFLKALGLTENVNWVSQELKHGGILIKKIAVPKDSYLDYYNNNIDNIDCDNNPEYIENID